MYANEISIPTGQVVPPVSAPGTTAVLSSDFQTFLQMLVTQAENQDPLNPIDSSDYAAQLASFATVEQQVMTNDLLKALTEQSVSGPTMAMEDWVGTDVLVDGPILFDGDPIVIRPTTAANATSAQLTVRDDQNQVVDIVALSVPTGSIEWPTTGTTPNVPTGHYTFEVASFADGQLLTTEQALAYANVSAVYGLPGNVTLELAGGTTIPETSVHELRISK